MAHKCTSRGCEFSLPDTYPLDKCPWHMVPGRGPVKIAAALAVAAAGLGGGFAYKKYKTYLHEKQLRKERKERRQRAASASEKESRKSVLFVTDLLQSLRNGHVNEKEPRRNRSQWRSRRLISATDEHGVETRSFPNSLAATLATLPSMSLIPPAPLTRIYFS